MLQSALTGWLSQFIEGHFLKYVERKRRPATLKFYRTTYKNHVQHRVRHIRIRDFTTKHAQDLLDAIPGLSHQSLLRIKALLSGVFTYARQDVIRSANPIQGVRAEGRRTKPERYAYSLEEIQHMLSVFPEPARTVVAVAVFAGLRAAELRGIRWDDFTGDELRVARTVWRTHLVEDTKTEASAANVPVIPIRRRALELHRKASPEKVYIFAGERRGTPLNLDNLSRRVIQPKVGDKWKGWHAFRRGLATNLYTLGISDKTIQAILRHANVSTTQTHYIVVESEKSRAAMIKFEKAVNKVWAKAESSKLHGQRMGKENKQSYGK